MRRPEKIRTAEARHTPVPLAECALARAITAIGDGWTLLILREAFYGITRFGEIQEDLGIPRAVLSDRLDKLVAAGLFERAAYREPGRRSRQAYKPTAGGRASMLALIALRDWAAVHLPGPASPLHLHHAGCGAEVRTRFVCTAGHVIEDGADVVPNIKRDVAPN